MDRPIEINASLFLVEADPNAETVFWLEAVVAGREFELDAAAAVAAAAAATSKEGAGAPSSKKRKAPGVHGGTSVGGGAAVAAALLDAVRAWVGESRSETLTDAEAHAAVPNGGLASVRHALAKLVKEGRLFAIDAQQPQAQRQLPAKGKAPLHRHRHGKAGGGAAAARQQERPQTYHNLMHSGVIGAALIKLIAAPPADPGAGPDEGPGGGGGQQQQRAEDGVGANELLHRLREADTRFINVGHQRLREALDELVANSDVYPDNAQRYHHVG